MSKNGKIEVVPVERLAAAIQDGVEELVVEHGERMLNVRKDALQQWMLADERHDPRKFKYPVAFKVTIVGGAHGAFGLDVAMSFKGATYKASAEPRQLLLPFGNERVTVGTHSEPVAVAAAAQGAAEPKRKTA